MNSIANGSRPVVLRGPGRGEGRSMDPESASAVLEGLVDGLADGAIEVVDLTAPLSEETPIISLPQCAILGVGRIAREPAVVNDQIVPRDQMTLSLTFDHRVIDGAPAARFLNDLRLALEHPAAALVQ